MNTNASASSASSAASRTSTRENTRQTDPHTLRREGDRFERLLRDKSAAREDDSGEDTLPGVPAECMPQIALNPLSNPLQGPAAAAAAVARAGAAAGDTATPTQAALGTAMAAQQPLQQPTGSNDLHTFQVSINEPMGLPLELRAVRVPQAGNVNAPATWALNIASPSRDASALSRHGARLDDRLRARGIDGTQVYVQRDEADDPEAQR
jgi:hypothetical protein